MISNLIAGMILKILNPHSKYYAAVNMSFLPLTTTKKT